MQAVIEISTNRVVFLRGDDAQLRIDETGLYGDIRALDVTSATHRLELVPDNAGFVAGYWGYSDEWFVLDAARWAEYVSERDAAALTAKREAMVCTPWKMRRAMTEKGIRSAVEITVAAADQDTKDAYEFAQEFKRLDPLVVNLAAVLGKSDEFMDELFLLAMSL